MAIEGDVHTRPSARAGSAAAPAAGRTIRLGAPPVPPELVVRRQLVDLLKRGTRGPLTLLSAPAGYGKTMLVNSWMRTVGSAATLARSTMRQFDAESGPVFWASAIEGLRRAGIDTSAVPAPAQPALRPPPLPQVRPRAPGSDC